MAGSDDLVQSGAGPGSDLLVGTPERNSAQEALEAHMISKRLDPGEYERRVETSRVARTQSELMLLFADLSVPHPTLPSAAEPPAEPVEEDAPLVFFAGCLMVVLGLPVAVVLGFVYGTWWALAVPVAVTVAMAYVEHLRSPRPDEPA